MRNRSFRPMLDVLDYRITPTQLAPVPVVAQIMNPPVSPVLSDEPDLPTDFSGNGSVGQVPFWVPDTPAPETPTPPFWCP